MLRCHLSILSGPLKGSLGDLSALITQGDVMKWKDLLHRQLTLEEAGSEEHFGTVFPAHVSKTTHLLKDSTAKLGKTNL